MYRAALTHWIRAELLRIGAPWQEIAMFTFRRYRLSTTTVSKAQLQRALAKHDTRIPVCLFRQAFSTGDDQDDQSIDSDLLLGPHVEVLVDSATELDDHQVAILGKFDWSREMGENHINKMTPLRAVDLIVHEVGTFKFIHTSLNHNELLISDPLSRTVEWVHPSEESMMGVHIDLQLHSGSFRINFVVDARQDHLLAIGFVLDWTPAAPDRGFCNLGSAGSSWAIEGGTGVLLFNNEDLVSDLFGLPDSSIVSLVVDLPRNSYGRAQFIVEGSPIISFLLPKSAVVVPAVCLTKQYQKVRLLSFGQQPVSSEAVASIEAEAKRLRKVWDAKPKEGIEIISLPQANASGTNGSNNVQPRQELD